MNTKKTKGNEQIQPASKKSGKRVYSFKNKLLTTLLLALTAPLTVCLFGPLETYCGNIDEFTNMLWTNLNEDNKVSLFVRYIDIATGEYETRIVNKNA